MREYTWLFYATMALTVLRFVWRQMLRYLNYRYLKCHKGEIPERVKDAFSSEDMEQVENYTLARMRYGTWESFFDFVVFLWWVFGGGFLWLYHLVVGWNLSFVWTGILLVGLSTLFFTVIQIPWDLYETFVLEARFGFTTTTLGLWISDHIKGLVLSIVLEFPLLWVALSVIENVPNLWWLVVWGVYVLFEVLIMYLAPYVIEPLFNTYEPLDKEYGDVIREWAEKQGVSVKAVLTMDASRRTKHSNAYFTGIGRVKRIVVFDTLLKNFSLEEILAILSHELGHWKRRHILKQLLVGFVLSFVGSFVVFSLLHFRLFSQAFGITREGALSPYGLFSEMFFLGVFVSGVGTWIQPVVAFFSRKMEKEADAYAVKVMGTAKPLQSALVKLYKENLSPFHVHPFVVRMTYSHPPLLERLSFLAHEEEKLRG
ncbi:MAG: M48 family metallopeptidase [Brevinematales bacterium]|nr:M48 family metallopeptidase [Brevinematales bacterium]